MTTETAQAVQAIALSPAKAMFPSRLRVEALDDGEHWELLSDFFFISPAPDVFPSIGVPRGFVTDFASIPKFFWPVLHPTHKHIARIAVVHDRYWHAPWIQVTQEHSDMALRAGMEALGSPQFERDTCYAVIRVFGWGFQPRVDQGPGLKPHKTLGKKRGRAQHIGVSSGDGPGLKPGGG